MATKRKTVVLLVRHGLTPTTGRVLPGRAPGLHLSDQGRAQSEALVERLAGVRPDALYTSPLERTRETAAPLAAASGLVATVEDGLVECDFGEWTGRELTELARLKSWRTVQQAPSTFRFPGGESFVELQARMVGTLDRLRSAHPGGTVVCFSHADPIKVALAHALGTPLDLFQRIAVDPASVSVLAHEPGRPPTVRTVNATGPLSWTS
ncbi:MSMEG_4193 family putative phosphomutase [Propioniciclava sinopodophylli]|uniref:MSMEG_4193 family putative phosphomutase n=1 Tax=Propioniciclava sinopodophylli TaxID=1837344 RepID=UPI002491846D|nr:MSMEG_4193 family putative phosphomutase [Propioniciclava sinopodophylli]